MRLIKQHIDKLREICDMFYVSELYLFGSATGNKFTEDSDIDFLVKFSGVDSLEYFDNYMDFKTALENLFSRKIDLLEIQAVRNPVLRQSIDRKKILLYGRENSKVAV